MSSTFSTMLYRIDWGIAMVINPSASKLNSTRYREKTNRLTQSKIRRQAFCFTQLADERLFLREMPSQLPKNLCDQCRTQWLILFGRPIWPPKCAQRLHKPLAGARRSLNGEGVSMADLVIDRTTALAPDEVIRAVQFVSWERGNVTSPSSHLVMFEAGVTRIRTGSAS